MKARGYLGVALLACLAAAPARSATPCATDLAGAIPDRSRRAPVGSAVMDSILPLSGRARDAIVAREILSGNVPGFLRKLMPVRFHGSAGGGEVEVVICVTPDYLAVGDDGDYVRTPLGLPAAAMIADTLGFLLPTPRMVDAIYAQAQLRLPPAPMKPTSAMTTTRYFIEHNATVDGQRSARGTAGLVAGQKKDLVLSARLRAKRGRVAIYGWHRQNGKPIQPLSTVHGADYADYSHGIRLVSTTAFVNGRPIPLGDLMQDPALAPLVSHEGPIPDTRGLLASLYR